MKRLVFVVCVLSMLVFPVIANLDFATATAAPRITCVDAKAIVGMTTSALTKKYGNPVRKEPSEYGFTWYVYNRDYKNFFMAGIRGSKVVALYTTAKTMKYGSSFKLNSTKSAVRKNMGKPISYIKSGNTVAVVPNASQKDMFTVGSNYVIAFYDLLAGSKVTSLMVVPIADENSVTVSQKALSSSLIAAYQRISVDLVNASRARRGLKVLKTDTMNTKLAVSRSADMRNRNYFSHYTPEKKSPFDLAKKMGIKYKSMGENIAFGNRNAMLAHETFMNSSGHRSNILKSVYTKVGAGVAYGGSRYVLLTNIFSR